MSLPQRNLRVAFRFITNLVWGGFARSGKIHPHEAQGGYAGLGVGGVLDRGLMENLVTIPSLLQSHLVAREQAESPVFIRCR